MAKFSIVMGVLILQEQRLNDHGMLRAPVCQAFIDEARYGDQRSSAADFTNKEDR